MTFRLSELNRRVRYIDEWILRRSFMGEVVDGERTWRKIKKSWPRATSASWDYVWQHSRKQSHGFVMGHVPAPAQRDN